MLNRNEPSRRSKHEKIQVQVPITDLSESPQEMEKRDKKRKHEQDDMMYFLVIKIAKPHLVR
jgi:hypothetical protein